jgi:hypothetical protein
MMGNDLDTSHSKGVENDLDTNPFYNSKTN